MIGIGIDIEAIAKITDLDIEDVRNIRDGSTESLTEKLRGAMEISAPSLPLSLMFD